jgi:hypothetical protein
MRKTLALLLCAAALVVLVAGCGKKIPNMVFTGTIVEIHEQSILVSTADDVGFDKASVSFAPDIQIGFNFLVGQTVTITILPQIAESYPVQVRAVAIELAAAPASSDPEHPDDEAKWPEAAPQYAESADVRMETHYSVYPEGTMTVLVKWFNEGTVELTGGELFTLEKLVDDVWRTVHKETDINYGFTLGGYLLPPGGSYWQDYGLLPYTDGLNAGKYRISAYVIVDYPECIQVYGYFEVGAAAEPRSVTCKDGVYEYVNTDYGFVLDLTPDWDGCAAEIIDGTGDAELDALAEKISDDWRALRIRHPAWSEDTPYQDIIFACVSLRDWNDGAGLVNAVGTNDEALPKRISNDTWMLLAAENTLDRTLQGYDTAAKALETMAAVR